MVVRDAYVFPGFLTPILTHFNFPKLQLEENVFDSVETIVDNQHYV